MSNTNNKPPTPEDVKKVIMASAPVLMGKQPPPIEVSPEQLTKNIAALFRADFVTLCIGDGNQTRFVCVAKKGLNKVALEQTLARSKATLEREFPAEPGQHQSLIAEPDSSPHTGE